MLLASLVTDPLAWARLPRFDRALTHWEQSKAANTGVAMLLLDLDLISHLQDLRSLTRTPP